MSAAIIDLLKNPTLIQESCESFNRFVSKSSVSSEEKSNLSIKILLETYKLLEVPSWTEQIDSNVLCSCVVRFCTFSKCQNTKDLQRFLAALCNIYRFIIKKVSVKVSNEIFALVFANKNVEISPKYAKIYRTMLVDKVNLFEAQIQDNDSIKDLTGNILKYIEASDLIEFCKTYMSWFVKKYFVLFSEKYPKHLEEAYKKIFNHLADVNISYKIAIPKNDASFQEMNKNFNYCLTYIVQNLIANDFKSNSSIESLSRVVSIALNIQEELISNFQVVYSAVKLFNDHSLRPLPNFGYGLSEIIKKVRDIARNNNKNASDEAFITLRKVLNCYLLAWSKKPVEYWETRMPIKLQTQILELMIIIIDYLNSCKRQLIQCANCKYISAIHDSLHLASLAKHFISKTVKNTSDISELVPLMVKMCNMHTENIIALKNNDCPNWKKLWSHVQMNYHSDSIFLHSLEKYDESILLFDAYFSNCMKIIKADSKACDLADLSRAYFNVSICYMDLNNYKESLKSCYLGMAINSLNIANASDNMKFIKCVIQIKVKALENKPSVEKPDENKCKENEDSDLDSILMFNVWTACCDFLVKDDNVFYEILSRLDFGKLLVEELEYYAYLWFSTIPIVGICKSIHELYKFADAKNAHKKLDLGYKLDFGIHCGKAITLIGTQTSKLHNSYLMDFVKFTNNILESLINDSDVDISSADMDFVKILYGNSLRAIYESVLHEKINKEPPMQLLCTMTPNKPPHHIAHPDDTCDIAPTHQSLTLSTEDEIVSLLLKALEIWNQITHKKDSTFFKNSILNTELKLYLDKTMEIMDFVVQTLSLRGFDIHALQAVDTAYTFSILTNNKIGILQTVSFIIGHLYLQNDNISKLIENANKIAKDFLSDNNAKDNNMMNYVLLYLLNLATYYFNSDSKEKGLVILTSVHNQIMQDYVINGMIIDDMKLSYVKLIGVQSHFINLYKHSSTSTYDCIGLLTNTVNEHVECSEFFTSVGRCNRHSLAILRLWIESGLQAGKLSLALGLPRRSRSILRSLLVTVQRLFLPRLTAEVLLILADIDLGSEKFDDCKVKLDAINYIMEDYNESASNNQCLIENIGVMKHSYSAPKINVSNHENSIQSLKQFEEVLDAPSNKYCIENFGGSPVFQSSPFTMPSFIDHKHSCKCKKCTNIRFFNLTLGINHIKAQFFFKTGELSVARSFFNGGLKLANYLNNRIKYIIDVHVIDIVNFNCDRISEYHFHKVFLCTEIRLLIDCSFFSITENDYAKAESLNEQAINLYSPCTLSSYLLKQNIYEQKIFLMQSKILLEDDKSLLKQLNELDVDFAEKLQLTPEKNVSNSHVFKTPCNTKHFKLPTQTNKIRRNIVKNLDNNLEMDVPEFIRPIIKLNLEDDEKPIRESKKTPDSKIFEFNINADKTPAPKTGTKKSLLSENNTRSTRSNSIKSNTKSKNTINLVDAKQKSRLIRSTSPGHLDQLEDNKKPSTSIKKLPARIKKEEKNTSSLNTDSVKKYSARKKI